VEYLKIAHRRGQKCKHFCLAPRARTTILLATLADPTSTQRSSIKKKDRDKSQSFFLAALSGRPSNLQHPNMIE